MDAGARLATLAAALLLAGVHLFAGRLASSTASRAAARSRCPAASRSPTPPCSSALLEHGRPCCVIRRDPCRLDGMSAPGDTTAEAVIYRGSEHSAQSLCIWLARESIEARILDDPNVFVRLSSLGTYRFRVAVPQEQAGRARGLLDSWHDFHTPRVRGLARRLTRIALAALAAPAAWGLLALVAPGAVPAPGLLATALLWLATFVVIARLESRRHGQGAASHDAGIS